CHSDYLVRIWGSWSDRTVAHLTHEHQLRCATTHYPPEELGTKTLPSRRRHEWKCKGQTPDAASESTAGFPEARVAAGRGRGINRAQSPVARDDLASQTNTLAVTSAPVLHAPVLQSATSQHIRSITFHGVISNTSKTFSNLLSS